MTFKQFMELPAELRLNIFAHCPKNDLKNMALTNKQCRDETQPSLWKSITLSWQRLETLRNFDQYKDHLLYTKQLSFTEKNSSVRDRRLGYKSFTFHHILKACNPKKLKSLNFQGFIVASGLELASEMLPAVTSLSLRRIEGDLCNDLEFVFKFRYLEVIEIEDCIIEGDPFNNIGDIKGLRVLKINYCRGLSGTCLRHINTIASGLVVFELSISHSVRQNDYKRLTNLKDVRKLSLRESEVGDLFFSRLKWELKYITILRLGSSNVTDSALPTISTYQSLRVLDLSQCDISDAGLKLVSKLTKLRRLTIEGCQKVTDLGLVHVSKIRRLTSLDMGNLPLISDGGLRLIMKLSSLTFLDLYCNHMLTDCSLKLISKSLLLLKYIDVTCDKFTIEGLNFLLALPNLKEVEYDLDEITDEDCAEFYSRLTSKSEQN